MVALRNTFTETAAPSTSPAAGAGIPIAVGRLAAFDQQTVRTMLRTLASHLGAHFRISDARDGELAILEDSAHAGSFILRARCGSNASDVRLPRPLRLMPLADGLNSVIDLLRPQTLPDIGARASDTTLCGLLATPTPAALRLTGVWGTCWLAPHSDEVVFDRPIDFVARALASSDDIIGRDTLPLGEAGSHFGAAATFRLRRDEVVWLCRPSAELQRVVMVKLAQPGATLKLQVWPNLSRLPQHARWLGTFAAMQDGIGIAEAMQLALADGLSEVEARRGLCVLLQLRCAAVQVRAPAPVRAIASASAPSFLQRLKTRLLQMVDTQ